jgi:hypothetical protein
MTALEICNLALSWLGEAAISALDEDSVAADLCTQSYAEIHDALLEERDWQWASRWEAVALDADAPVNPRYTMRLAKPAAALEVREVTDGDGDAVGWVLEGAYLLIDESCTVTVDGEEVDGAYVRYTEQKEDPTTWPANFSLSVAHRLASVLAVPLAESRALQASEWQLYEATLAKATSADSMQGRAFTGPTISALKAARNT